MRRILVSLTCLLLSSSLLADSGAVRPGWISAKDLEPFEAHYRQLVQGQEAGHRVHHLQRAAYPAGAGWRFVISILGADTVYDEIRFLAAGFEPVSRHVSARSQLQRIEVWEGLELRGVQLDGAGGHPTPVQGELEGPRFIGALELLLTALDLGSEPQDLAFFSSDFGEGKQRLTARVRQLRRETLELAGEKWKTRVIESRLLDAQGEPLLPSAMTLWILDRPPYLVQMEIGPVHLELEKAP